MMSNQPPPRDKACEDDSTPQSYIFERPHFSIADIIPCIRRTDDERRRHSTFSTYIDLPQLLLDIDTDLDRGVLDETDSVALCRQGDDMGDEYEVLSCSASDGLESHLDNILALALDLFVEDSTYDCSDSESDIHSESESSFQVEDESNASHEFKVQDSYLPAQYKNVQNAPVINRQPRRNSLIPGAA